MAAGTLGGDVRVWQVADRMPLVSAHGHTGSVGGVALSADGRTATGEWPWAQSTATSKTPSATIAVVTLLRYAGPPS